jgi:hypothetical protein
MNFDMFPTKGEFLSQYANNDNLRNQANALWKQLENIKPILYIVAVVIALAFCVYYYKWYNEKPGRHYKIEYWLRHFLYSGLATAIATFILECFLIKTNLDAWSLYMGRVVICTAISLGMYFLASWLWCSCLPTNAYRFLKFPRK